MLIEISQTTPNPPIRYPGTQPHLRGYYSRRFTAGDGATPVEWGDGRNGFYYDIECDVNGDGNLVIPAFEIQSTTDGNLPTSRFTGQLFTQSLAPAQIIFGGNTGWQIPTQYGDNVDWATLFRYNQAARLLNPPPSYYTQEQVIQEILALAGEFDYARVGHNGIVQLSYPPLVASAPIVITETDPRVSGLPDFGGSGTDTLIATVPTTVIPPTPALRALVTANAPIDAIGAADTVGGPLVVTNRVVGSSFDVFSREATDVGLFRWFLYPEV